MIFVARNCPARRLTGSIQSIWMGQLTVKSNRPVHLDNPTLHLVGVTLPKEYVLFCTVADFWSKDQTINFQTYDGVTLHKMFMYCHDACFDYWDWAKDLICKISCTLEKIGIWVSKMQLNFKDASTMCHLYIFSLWIFLPTNESILSLPEWKFK